MKYHALALVAFIATPALAQQPSAPSQDPQVAVYRQLLGEANDRLAATSAQAQKQIDQLQQQLAAEKAKNAPAAPPQDTKP